MYFFTRGEPTKEVWYYQMTPPVGMKQYTKNRGIADAEFAPVKEWWDSRSENPTQSAWRVTIEDIQARNFNLDFKNPKVGEVVEELSSKELVERILKGEEEIKEILKTII